MKTGALITFAVVLGCCGALAPVTACTKEQGQQVITIAPNAAQCLEDVVGDVSGAIDIVGTLTHCGVTIEQLVAYLEGYFKSGDAGSDAAMAASPAKLQRAKSMLDAARAYQASHK